MLPAAVLAFAGGLTLDLGASRSPQTAASTSGPIDAAVLKAYQWRSIGPDRAGRSIASSGVKGRPKEAYSGQTGGGLWKTVDAGETWVPVTDGKITSSSVGAVAVSETNPDLVWIGMGEQCIRGNIQPGDGIYKSTDAGKTWTHMGFKDSDAISRIRIHPTNPDVVFLADFGRYGVPSEERGVFKTTDGGKTWRKVLYRDNKTGAVDIAIDRNNPNVMFAALWEAFRVEYSMSSGGPGSGLFKSTDGGEHWTEITRNPGLPAGMIGKIGVAVSGADSNRIYAIVENENGGLFSSDDAGATWKLVNAGPQHPPARVLLHARRGGPEEQGHRLGAERRHVLVARRRQDDGELRRRRLARPVDRSRRHRTTSSTRTTAAAAVSYNAQAQQRTWSARDYPTAQYYHVDLHRARAVSRRAARSRTAAPCACRATRISAAGGRGGGGGGRGGGAAICTALAARSPATSRPIRSTPTSSTPAATTDRS